MANIAGKYFTRCLIPDTEYEFTDDANARNASFQPSTTGSELVTLNATNSVALNAPVILPTNNEFRINRVRLQPVGADKLQPGNASPFLAAKISFGVGIEDPENPGAVLPLDEIHLTITRWGEWEECNKVLMPFRNMAAVNIENYTSVFFYVYKNDCTFWCDDYNIQGSYKGEKTRPVLEMEVNTAGLYDTVNKVLF
jgi:hypothetical protein